VNVLTGDAKAGQAYFNGAGGCTKCHNVAGDLAAIGKKYDPVTLQQKFLFPRSFGFGRGGGGASPPKPTMVTVTPAGGKPTTGVLTNLDDFNVALRDAQGEYFSWARNATLKVELNDPYAEHIALLDKYTDKDIHNVVRYLEGLK
jgi:cytochrome c oxidase cbb3-type subunit III